jgi:Holliday junction resolvase
MREVTLRTKAVNWLRRHGAKVLVLNMTPYLPTGEPDVIACLRGRTVVIETKTQRGRLRPLQRRALLEWRRAGAMALVLRGPAGLVALEGRLRAAGLLRDRPRKNSSISLRRRSP